MAEIKLGVIESRFADIIWTHEPLPIRDLIDYAKEELNWSRTTTYTILHRLYERGIFKNEGGMVTSLISREEFYSLHSKKYVEETFSGSLPAFFAAFTKGGRVTREEADAIRRMIDEAEEV